MGEEPPNRDAPRAGARREVGPAEALALAVELHRSGQLDAAEGLYRKVLEAEPRQADALHFLGILAHQRGRGEEAERLIGRAIELAPGHADAHSNLGNVLKERGLLERAEAAYREALRLRSDHADAHNNLGTLLRVRGALDEAEAAYRRAIELSPGHADAHYNLGTALWQRALAEPAIAAYRRSIELQPRNPRAYEALGRIFYRTGERERAREVYERWLAVEPASATARHMLAACTGHGVPPRASDAYLRETFDAFAAAFDRNLANLGYRAPELVAGTLARRLAGREAGTLDLLDAGCGTGLCGPLLRPLARRLVGVDLSPAMLERARERGAYDELAAAELTAFLRERARAFDAVASADTLCYFGELDGVLQALRHALREGGWVVFTLERLEEDAGETGLRLEAHGRYAHTESHVRRALGRAGYDEIAIEAEVLRQEAGQPVGGLVVAARLAADS